MSGYWKNGTFQFTNRKGNDLTLGNLWQDYTGISNVYASLEAQALENEKNREYNLNLAREQNRENLAQWNRENAYNSPSSQKARLVAAGLNPDMMYGGSGVMNTAASSPSMTSGASSSPMDWSSLANVKTLGSAVGDALEYQLKQAQIDNINADTQKKGAETSILSSDASFRDAWNRGLLETQNIDIRVKSKDIELSDQQIKESMARVRELDASVSKISKEMESIVNSMRNDNARLDLEKAFNSANINRLAASTNLDRTQANSIAKQLESILRQFNDKHAIDEQTVINLGHQGNILLSESGAVQFEARVRSRLGYDENMSTWQNVMSFTQQILSTLGTLVHK